MKGEGWNIVSEGNSDRNIRSELSSREKERNRAGREERVVKRGR